LEISLFYIKNTLKIYAKCVSKTVSKKHKDIFQKFINVFNSIVKISINFLNVRRLFLKLFLLINFA